jgi:hypothetical protein
MPRRSLTDAVPAPVPLGITKHQAVAWPPDLYNAVVAVAVAEDRSFSDAVRHLVKLGLRAKGERS